MNAALSRIALRSESVFSFRFSLADDMLREVFALHSLAARLFYLPLAGERTAQ